MSLSKRTPRVSWKDKNGVARSYTFTEDDYLSYHPEWERVENEYTHPFTGERTRLAKGYYLTVSLGISSAPYVTRDKFAWGGLLNAGNTEIRLHTHSDKTQNIYTTISSATSTTVVVSGITATLNQYATKYLKIITGDGIGQLRSVVSNTATSEGLTSFTVTAWTVTPEAGDSICINALNEESYEVDMGGIGYDDALGNFGSNITLIFRSKKRYEQPINPPDDTWGNRTLDFTTDIDFTYTG